MSSPHPESSCIWTVLKITEVPENLSFSFYFYHSVFVFCVCSEELLTLLTLRIPFVHMMVFSIEMIFLFKTKF